jgi:hypothetical protein
MSGPRDNKVMKLEKSQLNSSCPQLLELWVTVGYFNVIP